MRTGFVGDLNNAPMDETLHTVGALMRLFCKESAKIASTYTFTRGRTVVTANDMKKSLKYVARTFFQSEDLEKNVELEKREMEEEEDEEEEDGEEEDGEEEDGEEEDEKRRREKRRTRGKYCCKSKIITTVQECRRGC